MSYRLIVTPSAARTLAIDLPEAVATAVLEFVTGVLLENPHQSGKPLHAPLAGRWVARRGQYRVVYKIDSAAEIVTVLHISHRATAYR